MVHGPGTLDRLGNLARENGITRALLVTDAGIVAAGHVERARQALESASVEVVVWDQVVENPDTRCVDACVLAARGAGIDGFIGLGGGSSIDTARGANFVLTNGGRMQDYWGIGKATRPMLPLIAVPTTSGTGSECQSFALIADAETHQKMACGDPMAAARVALLDPTLTLSQPRLVTACTGIDAIAHGLETAVTRQRTAISQFFSRESLRLTLTHLSQVLDQPDNLAARGAMQLGAAYAGMAIEASMLGAAHSCANPLTARFHVVHGHAVGLMLPHVIRFNASVPEAGEGYREIAAAAVGSDAARSAEEAADALGRRVQDLLRQAGLASTLRKLDIPEASLPELAEGALKQWTAQFNPRELSLSDFASLYAAAY